MKSDVSDEEPVSVVWDGRCQSFRLDDWISYQPQLFQYVRDEVRPEQKVLSAMKTYAVQRGHISLHKSARPWEKPEADPSDWFNCGFTEKSWHCFYRRVLGGGYEKEHRHHHRRSEERKRDEERGRDRSRERSRGRDDSHRRDARDSQDRRS